jgi:hypothetical protein
MIKKALVAVSALVVAVYADYTPVNTLGGGNGSELNLQEVLNQVTVGGTSSVDAFSDADQLDDAFDSYWGLTATGGSVSTIVFEIAGYDNQNVFGVFDRNDPTKKVQLFNAAAGGYGTTPAVGTSAQATLSILLNGEVEVNNVSTGITFSGTQFGYYLGSPDGLYFSDSDLNLNKEDRMVAYQGKDVDYVQLKNRPAGLWTSDEYVLAWEDRNALNSDWDYNDMVIMVESVKPVPEPATLSLFAMGFVGMLGMGWIRRKKA